MSGQGIHAVTGAFGYSGGFIARRLLDEGREVVTLTNSSPPEDPFGGRVRAFPLNFDDPAALRKSLEGVEVLYNTYWVRFSRPGLTHEDAVRNTEALFSAAADAGVERIVHISITNPSLDSPISYFRCKARMEQSLQAVGVSWAILRPAILFGGRDILVNNIAWSLRRLPVFGVFGDGSYKIQPVYVGDLAQLAVEQGSSRENAVVNAIGPETFTFRELVREIAGAIGRRRLVAGVPPALGYLFAWAVGRLHGDVMLTRDEVRALMSNMLFVDSPPAGVTKLTDWARANAATLGVRYASELARRKRPAVP